MISITPLNLPSRAEWSSSLPPVVRKVEPPKPAVEAPFSLSLVFNTQLTAIDPKYDHAMNPSVPLAFEEDNLLLTNESADLIRLSHSWIHFQKTLKSGKWGAAFGQLDGALKQILNALLRQVSRDKALAIENEELLLYALINDPKLLTHLKSRTTRATLEESILNELLKRLNMRSLIQCALSNAECSSVEQLFLVKNSMGAPLIEAFKKYVDLVTGSVPEEEVKLFSVRRKGELILKEFLFTLFFQYKKLERPLNEELLELDLEVELLKGDWMGVFRRSGEECLVKPLSSFATTQQFCRQLFKTVRFSTKGVFLPTSKPSLGLQIQELEHLVSGVAKYDPRMRGPVVDKMLAALNRYRLAYYQLIPKKMGANEVIACSSFFDRQIANLGKLKETGFDCVQDTEYRCAEAPEHCFEIHKVCENRFFDVYGDNVELYNKLETWNLVLNALVHWEGLRIDMPSAFIIRENPNHEEDSDPFCLLLIYKKTLKPDCFEKEFQKLPKQEQTRIARDLCRFISLTGFDMIDFSQMELRDGKILLGHTDSRWAYTWKCPRESGNKLAEITLRKIITKCGRTKLPVLRLAAQEALNEMFDCSEDTPEKIDMLQRFLQAMRAPAVDPERSFHLFEGVPSPIKKLILKSLSEAHDTTFKDKSFSQLDPHFWHKKLEADPTVLLSIRNRSGMDLLGQIEIRFAVVKALTALRFSRRCFVQDGMLNSMTVTILIHCLNDTLFGAQLLLSIAGEFETEGSRNAEVMLRAFQHTIYNDPQRVLKTIDRYIEALNDHKHNFSIDALEGRFAKSHRLLLDSDPVQPLSKEQLMIKNTHDVRPRLKVLIVAYECAKFGMKHGGLADAVHGMASSLRDKGYRVTLLMPLFKGLPPDIQSSLAHNAMYDEIEFVHHWPIHGGMSRRCDLLRMTRREGIDLLYVDGEELELDYFDIQRGSDLYLDGSLGIRGPKYHGLKERMAYFSHVVAEFVQLKDRKYFDAVIYNEWHAAYALDRVVFGRFSDWLKGGDHIPAQVFVIHNNSYGCQGVFGLQDRDTLAKCHDNRKGVNVMESALKLADLSLTVSDQFALEMQDERFGLTSGIGNEVRQAAHQGKFKGIVNGSNPNLWNPQTDSTLKNWKTVEVLSRPLDLSFSPDTPQLPQHKRLIREQLYSALQQYYPEALQALGCKKKEEFVNKPLMLFVGRYDSSQKGLDKLLPILQVAEKSGAMLITMGVAEDEQAKEILDRVQHHAEKYGCGWITRGDKSGSSLCMQQGDPQRGIPPLGSLIRATADFFVMPSSFEPCGLVQFEGWLFGALVIGTYTGGLADTIHGDPQDLSFNGFTFPRCAQWESEEQVEHVSAAVEKALTYWRGLNDQQQHAHMVRVMQQASMSSWTSAPAGLSPADKYLLAIAEAIRNKKRRTIKSVDLTGVDDPDQPERNNYFGNNPFPDLHRRFGAHIEHGGVRFRVMAPAAKKVDLMLANDAGIERRHEMLQLSDGSWETWRSDAEEGSIYAYEMINAQDKVTRKSDPFAFGFQLRPQHRSVVARSKPSFLWTDSMWMKKRVDFRTSEAPVNIYEVHLGSLKRKHNGDFLNYRELAVYLGKRCHNLSFSHVELVGLYEHLSDESMGYLVLGYFAPTSRHGTLEDFQFFVNHLHSLNIGVLLDFVPHHFGIDHCGLREFDGTLFFEEQELLNRSTGWGSIKFGFASADVHKFLLSSAQFFLEVCHIDGYRVDAVANMMSFARFRTSFNEWRPGCDGTEWNPGAIQFLRSLNKLAHEHHQALMIAENSWDLDFRDTLPEDHPQGLGFDLRWTMQTRDRVLEVVNTPATKRTQQAFIQQKKAQLTYLPHQMSISAYFSHDEAKQFNLGSYGMLKNLPPANRTMFVKLFHAFNAFLPQNGRLMFMGTEFGAMGSWDPTKVLQISILKTPEHREMYDHCVRINKFYREHRALWTTGKGMCNFKWADLAPDSYDPQSKPAVLMYERIDPIKRNKLLIIHNLALTAYTHLMLECEEMDINVVYSSNFHKIQPGTCRIISMDRARLSFVIKVAILSPLETIVIEKVVRKPPTAKLKALPEPQELRLEPLSL